MIAAVPVKSAPNEPRYLISANSDMFRCRFLGVLSLQLICPEEAHKHGHSFGFYLFLTGQRAMLLTKPAVPCRHRAFDIGLLQEWSILQYRAWLWRKTLEPGGMLHTGRVAFSELAPAAQAFICRLAPAALDLVRFLGKPALSELRAVGEIILADEPAISSNDWREPLEGLPLKSGHRATLRRELAIEIAYQHHALWLSARDWSQLLPKELRQAGHAAHVDFVRGEYTPRWNGDIITAYALAVALAAPSFEESYQTVFEASGDEPLGFAPFAAQFPRDFQADWWQHFEHYSEHWRKIISNELYAPFEKVRWHKMRSVSVVSVTERAEGMLEIGRLYGNDALEELRAIGRGLVDEGTSDYARCELVTDLAEEHRLLCRGLLAQYADFPLTSVKKYCERKASDDRQRDEDRVFGFCLALATMKDEQFELVLNG